MRYHILAFFCLFNTTSTFEKKTTNEKIFVTTIFKCGSHLLLRLIDLMIEKKVYPLHKIDKGTTYHAHNWPVELDSFMPELSKDYCFASHSHCALSIAKYLKENGYKVLFIRRDPRGQFVSHVFHQCKFENYDIKNFDSLLLSKINQINAVYNRLC